MIPRSTYRTNAKIINTKYLNLNLSLFFNVIPLLLLLFACACKTAHISPM